MAFWPLTATPAATIILIVVPDIEVLYVIGLATNVLDQNSGHSNLLLDYSETATRKKLVLGLILDLSNFLFWVWVQSYETLEVWIWF